VSADQPLVELTELSNLLWRERRLLDLLQFKLDEECLLLETGRDHWLAHAAREVELVLDALNQVEMARALELAAVGRQFGLGAQPTLADVGAAVAPPWDALLDDHRAALLRAVAEVRKAAEAARPLLAVGRASASAELEALVEEAEQRERVS
jgi:hypothetical protein